METDSTQSAASLAAARQRLLEQMLAEEGFDVSSTDALRPRANRDEGPLTTAQEVLWLLDRATPGLTAYNTPMAWLVRGPLDVSILERALTLLVERHEALRTVFGTRGEQSVQIVRA